MTEPPPPPPPDRPVDREDPPAFPEPNRAESPANPGGYPSYPAPPPGPGLPQPGYSGPPIQPPPPNNMVWAILCTVLCCLPLGVVAIVKAGEVERNWYQGYPDQAHKAADDARKWAMWGAIIAVAGYLLLFLAYAIGFAVFLRESHR